jgi:predicted anti-sigma-YlaC factor YlaD
MNGHAGDLLSALLDGELGSTDEAGVRAHLLECEACRRELDIVADGRRVLRGLPQLEPPFGMLQRARHPARRWAHAAVAALAAGAAASVAMVGLAAPREAPVSPPVARFVDVHTASASASGDPVSDLTPVAVPVSFNR